MISKILESLWDSVKKVAGKFRAALVFLIGVLNCKRGEECLEKVDPMSLIIMGIILGFGAPMGWYLIESLLSLHYGEPHYRGVLYLYLTMGTIVVFVIFGVVLAIRLEKEKQAKEEILEREKELFFLKHEAEREKDELRHQVLKVSAAAASLSKAKEETQVLYTLVRTVKMNLDFDRVNLLLRDGDVLKIKTSGGIKEKGSALENIELPCNEKAGALGMVCKDGIPCIFSKNDYIPPEYRLKPPYSEIEGFRSQAFIMVPVKVPGDDAVYGVLGADRKYSNRDVNENDLLLIEILADMAGAAIKRIQMQKELERHASIDELTNIFNRRMWMEYAEHTLKTAKRYKDSLSLIMIDIDDFKTVNDTWGHQKGDKVLQVVASILKENSRESDIVGRYGGEEFVVLCPRTHLDNAVEVAERLRKSIEEASYGIPRRVTATFGVAEAAPEDIEGLNLDAILFKADKALYAGKKREGKNCVVTWNEIENKITPLPSLEDEGDVELQSQSEAK
jgi:diguanylate cyclase (GGDEF)-like protein